MIGRDNFSSGGDSADIIGVGRNNAQANTLMLGNGSYTNIRANSTCDLGTTAIPFQSLYLNGSIAGATNSRTADNIVSNAGTATSGRVATFSSNKVIQDGGTLLSDLATTAAVAKSYHAKAGGTMAEPIAMGTNNITGRCGQLSHGRQHRVQRGHRHFGSCRHVRVRQGGPRRWNASQRPRNHGGSLNCVSRESWGHDGGRYRNGHEQHHQCRFHLWPELDSHSR